MARHDETEMTLMNDRNIHALHEALKIEQRRTDALQTQVEAQNRTIAGVRQEIDNLRTSLVAMIAAR